MVDARANTKVRPKLSIVEKPPPEDEEEAGIEDVDDDDDIKLVSKVVRKKRREKREEKRWNRSRKMATKIENQMPSFLDPKLWHRSVFIYFILLVADRWVDNSFLFVGKRCVAEQFFEVQ